MPWFNADDKMHGHPKVRRAGLEAIGLWVLAGAHSVANGTPGFISRESLRSLTTKRKPLKLLIQEGFWQERPDGWTFRGEGEYWRFTGERAPISESLRRLIYERDGWACLHCGAAEDLSLDHIWPWSKGGSDTEDNLQTLCRSCNSKKGARVPA
jgi:hypothetical protein